MVVIVCGGRHFSDRDFAFKALSALHAKYPITKLVHGEAPGADNLGRLWAHESRIPCKGYKAEWERYGNSAGPIRNQRMLDESCPDFVVAFPGGPGTAHMVRIAKAKGVKVWNLSTKYQKVVRERQARMNAASQE